MRPDPGPDRDKLRQKIQFVRDSLRELESIRERGRAAFLSDSILQAAAVRNLQVAIEAILDAANHIVAREGLGIPETYRQSVELLIRAGILPHERADDLARMVRFRNRAVHLYDDIQPDEIQGILDEHLDDFEMVIESLVRRYLRG